MESYKIITDDNSIYPMGVSIMQDRIHISVASDGDTCSLLLFGKEEKEPCFKIPMPQECRIGDVWNLTLAGLDAGAYRYCLEVDGNPEPDQYGRSFYGWEQWGSLNNAEQTLTSPLMGEGFDWEGDKPLYYPYEDSIIYRIHVRGFTKHPSSKVPDKGTFRAVIQKIPYMKELGITAVELMPVNEFQEVMMPGGIDGNPYGSDKPTGKINYWGYTQGYCFAPKASYSSGRDKHPVSEFKQLVKELHKAGIEVIAELYFDGGESPTFVLDTVRFWVNEYHLDGLHLVGHAPVQLIGKDPYLSRIKLLATSWDGIDGGRVRHLGEYNEGFLIDMRRLLKGDEDQVNNLIFRSRQNPKRCGVINYMANTNGFTMMDMVSYDIKHNEANGENNQDGNAYNHSWNCGVEGPTRKKKLVELRKKQIRNAMLLLFLSQGTPLLMAGDEFGKSKSGNNNTYCQDNELSWLNWNQLKTNSDLYAFVKHMISFRKAHPVFHMEQEPRIMDYLACGHPDVSYHGVKAWCPEFENFRRQLGILYCGTYGKKPDGTVDDYFYVAYNMHWEPHDFSLPNLPKKMNWYVAVNSDESAVNGFYEAGEELKLEDQKQFVIPERTIVVFIGR